MSIDLFEYLIKKKNFMKNNFPKINFFFKTHITFLAMFIIYSYINILACKITSIWFYLELFLFIIIIITSAVWVKMKKKY